MGDSRHRLTRSRTVEREMRSGLRVDTSSSRSWIAIAGFPDRPVALSRH